MVGATRGGQTGEDEQTLEASEMRAQVDTTRGQRARRVMALGVLCAACVGAAPVAYGAAPTGVSAEPIEGGLSQRVESEGYWRVFARTIELVPEGGWRARGEAIVMGPEGWALRGAEVVYDGRTGRLWAEGAGASLVRGGAGAPWAVSAERVTIAIEGARITAIDLDGIGSGGAMAAPAHESDTQAR